MDNWQQLHPGTDVTVVDLLHGKDSLTPVMF